MLGLEEEFRIEEKDGNAETQYSGDCVMGVRNPHNRTNDLLHDKLAGLLGTNTIQSKLENIVAGRSIVAMKKLLLLLSCEGANEFPVAKRKAYNPSPDISDAKFPNPALVNREEKTPHGVPGEAARIAVMPCQKQPITVIMELATKIRKSVRNRE